MTKPYSSSSLAIFLLLAAACSHKGLGAGSSAGGAGDSGSCCAVLGSGGTPGSGGLLASGGVPDSGGVFVGGGGALGRGGETGSGGRPGSGGIQGAGGSAGSGGTPSVDGAPLGRSGGNLAGTGGLGGGSLAADGGTTPGGSGGLVGGQSGGRISTGGAGFGGSTEIVGVGGNVTCSGTTLSATNDHNYSFASTLTFPLVKVAPKTDLTFDWSGVTKDFIGHSLDTKKDLNTMLMLMWKLTPDDLQVKLNTDNLRQRDLVTLPLQYITDGSGTSSRLLAFTNSGAPDPATILSYMDPLAYPLANYTYTFMAATGSVLGEGTRMIQSFQVDPISTNATVKMTSDSTRLTYAADLHTLTPAAVPAGRAAITLEYSQLTKNALGGDWIASNITSVLVGHYKETPTTLESKFLDLELIAIKLYRGDITSGTKAIFSNLKTAAGESFTGIDDTGTWVVALQCGGCRNPAPWYLTILKACAP